MLFWGLVWGKEEAFLVQNMMILKVVLRVDAPIYNISVLRVFDTSKKIFLLKCSNAIRNSNMGSTIELKLAVRSVELLVF